MNSILRTLNSDTFDLDTVISKLAPYDKKGDVPLTHLFGDNLYVRQASYSKGSVIIGRIHKYDHVFFLVSGKLSIWTRDSRFTIEGPCMFESKAGVQRVGYVHANAIVINMHGVRDGVDLKDCDLEEAFTAATQIDYEKFVRVLDSDSPHGRGALSAPECPKLAASGAVGDDEG